ncbi:MAG: hypothetical protein AAF432_04935 [Planctomycetota bacterium]
MATLSKRRAALTRWLATFYTGVIIGVSFIATPAKFLVDDLTVGQLLLVGRATFGVFGWIELTLAGALCFLGWSSGAVRWVIGLVLLIVVVQIFGLRPTMDDRVTEIINGASSESSLLHYLYVAMELAKIGLLVLVSAAIRARR